MVVEHWEEEHDCRGPLKKRGVHIAHRGFSAKSSSLGKRNFHKIRLYRLVGIASIQVRLKKPENPDVLLKRPTHILTGLQTCIFGTGRGLAEQEVQKTYGGRLSCVVLG